MPTGDKNLGMSVFTSQGILLLLAFYHLQPGRVEAIKLQCIVPFSVPSTLCFWCQRPRSHVSGLFTVFLLRTRGLSLSSSHLPRTFLRWFKGKLSHVLELWVRCRQQGGEAVDKGEVTARGETKASQDYRCVGATRWGYWREAEVGAWRAELGEFKSEDLRSIPGHTCLAWWDMDCFRGKLGRALNRISRWWVSKDPLNSPARP